MEICPVDTTNYQQIYASIGDDCWNAWTTQSGEGIDFTDGILSEQECACFLKFDSAADASAVFGVDIFTCSIDGMESAGDQWVKCDEWYGGTLIFF